MDAKRSCVRWVKGMDVGGGHEAVRYRRDDHMGWDAGSGQFIKTSPHDLPLLEVQVNVL